MADVFLSYSKSEPSSCLQVVKHLESCGISVWFDKNMSTGAQYERLITEEIKNSRAVIVVWSRSSIDSQWVYSEAQDAWEQRKLSQVLTLDVAPQMVPKPFKSQHAFKIDQLAELVLDLSMRTGMIIGNRTAESVNDKLSLIETIAMTASNINTLRRIAAIGAISQKRINDIQSALLAKLGNRPTRRDTEKFIKANPEHPMASKLERISHLNHVIRDGSLARSEWSHLYTKAEEGGKQKKGSRVRV